MSGFWYLHYVCQRNLKSVNLLKQNLNRKKTKSSLLKNSYQIFEEKLHAVKRNTLDNG